MGGSGSVDFGVTTITFSSSFNIAASTTVNYILIGDVANLAIGDTMMIALGASNVTLSSGAVGGSTTNVTHTVIGNKVAPYTTATSGTSWTVPSGVTSITVKAWGAGGGGGGGTSSYAGGNGAGAGFALATFSVTPGSPWPGASPVSAASQYRCEGQQWTFRWIQACL